MDASRRIMNLPCPKLDFGHVTRNYVNAHKLGHRDARHAAAEIAFEQEAVVAQMLAALERVYTAYTVSHSPEHRASCWSDVRAAIRAAKGEA